MAEVKVGHISKTKFYISIDKISELALQEVTIPGQAWSITFVKTSNTTIIKASKQNGSNLAEKTEDVLVVNLSLENNGENSVDWACVASLSVKLLRSTDVEHALHRQIGPFVFDVKNKVCGQKVLFKWNDLLKAENGYVHNDSCKFEVEIDAGQIQNVSSDQWLKFDIIEKCCDKSTSGIFGLTINNLHESNQVCSPEIHFNNSIWRILVMKDEQLTVSLWKVETMSHSTISAKKFITVLKSFDQNVNSIKKVTKTTGIHPSPLELFSMPWKDLADSQKKFIENGSFNLEIEMKMHATEESTGGGFDMECPICLGSMFTMNRGISVTSCGHLFCTECISQHFAVTTTFGKFCPACQQVNH